MPENLTYLFDLTPYQLIGVAGFLTYILAASFVGSRLIGLFGMALRAWKAWPSTQRVLNATLDKEVA